MKFELGKMAVDKITGFKGLLTGYADYLTGCEQYLVQPKCKSDVDTGEYPIAQWFDEGRLYIVDGDETKKEEVIGKKNGCDYTAPKK